MRRGLLPYENENENVEEDDKKKMTPGTIDFRGWCSWPNYDPATAGGQSILGGPDSNLANARFA